MDIFEFIAFLSDKRLIDVDQLRQDSEEGFVNRLKLQKYVYLAQTCFEVGFSFDYNIYRNGPYSPGLANYYFQKLDLPQLKTYVENVGSTNIENQFQNTFLDLFQDKDTDWLEVATTLIDTSYYFDSEKEAIAEVCTIKSMFDREYIQNIQEELKENALVNW